MPFSSGESPINRAEALEVLTNLEAIKRRLLTQHPDLHGELKRREEFGADGGYPLPGSVPMSADDHSDVRNLSGLNPRSPQIGPAAQSHALQRKLLPLPNFSRSPSKLSAAEAEDIKALIREELLADRVIHSQTRQTWYSMSPISEHPTSGRESVENGHDITTNHHGLLSHEPAIATGWAEQSSTPEKKDGAVEVSVGGATEEAAVRLGSGHTSKSSTGAETPLPQNGHRRESLGVVDAHTDLIYPSAGIARTASKADVEHDYEGNAENAYGAFIHISLQHGLFDACYKCGPMLVVSVLIQFAFSYELFRYLPPLNESPWFCDLPWDLQVSAVGVFITLMLNNVWGMITACWISLHSDERKITTEDGDVKEAIRVGRFQRFIIFVLAVLTEIATWSLILSSGVLFILTSRSVDLVIRSTVAIMFVQNVDEIIFESCCSREIKDSLRTSSYKTFHPLSLFGCSRRTSLVLENRYALFVHLPVILCISGGVVFGMRLLPELDCLHF